MLPTGWKFVHPTQNIIRQDPEMRGSYGGVGGGGARENAFDASDLAFMGFMSGQTDIFGNTQNQTPSYNWSSGQYTQGGSITSFQNAFNWYDQRGLMQHEDVQKFVQSIKAKNTIQSRGAGQDVLTAQANGIPPIGQGTNIMQTGLNLNCSSFFVMGGPDGQNGYSLNTYTWNVSLNQFNLSVNGNLVYIANMEIKYYPTSFIATAASEITRVQNLTVNLFTQSYNFVLNNPSNNIPQTFRDAFQGFLGKLGTANINTLPSPFYSGVRFVAGEFNGYP